LATLCAETEEVCEAVADTPAADAEVAAFDADVLAADAEIPAFVASPEALKELAAAAVAEIFAEDADPEAALCD
jgi:hypothetical protein